MKVNNRVKPHAILLTTYSLFVIFIFGVALVAQPVNTETEKQKQTEGQSEKKPAEQKSEKKTSVNPEALGRIRQVLRFGNSQQVREILVRVPKLTEDEQLELLPELKALTKSKDAMIQRRLVEAIGMAAFSDLDDHLSEALEHPNDDVFFAACGAIEKKKPETARAKVAEKLRQANFSTPNNKIPDLMRAMSGYRDVPISEFLLDKLRDPSTTVDFKNQILRYFSVVKVENSALNTYISELVKDESAVISVRSYAVYAAGELKIFALKDDLTKLLEKIDGITDPDEKKKYSRLRLQVITSLLKLEAENVDQILFDMARDDDETVRLRAIRQLGQFNRPEIIELLEFKAKYDNSLRVQREAKKALESLREGKKNSEAETAEGIE